MVHLHGPTGDWMSTQELTGEDVLETSENRLPEFQAAQRTKKDNFETTAEWFQANNKRRLDGTKIFLRLTHDFSGDACGDGSC